MSLFDEICIGFHDLPVECWTPSGSEQDYRSEGFWLNHLYSGEVYISDAFAGWIPEAKWPKVDDRVAYFLRIQLEHLHKFIASDSSEDIRKLYSGDQKEDDSYRRVIVRLLREYWTRDDAFAWAAEAVYYRSPRRVYLRDPRKASAPESPTSR